MQLIYFNCFFVDFRAGKIIHQYYLLLGVLMVFAVIYEKKKT